MRFRFLSHRPFFSFTQTLISPASLAEAAQIGIWSSATAECPDLQKRKRSNPSAKAAPALETESTIRGTACPSSACAFSYQFGEFRFTRAVNCNLLNLSVEAMIKSRHGCQMQESLISLALALFLVFGHFSLQNCSYIAPVAVSAIDFVLNNILKPI